MFTCKRNSRNSIKISNAIQRLKNELDIVRILTVLRKSEVMYKVLMYQPYRKLFRKLKTFTLTSKVKDKEEVDRNETFADI